MPDEARRQEALAQRLVELATVTRRLEDTHAELAQVLETERRAKVEVWTSLDPSSSDRARDRIADYNAVDHTAEVFQLRGETTRLDLERNFLLLVIDVLRSPHWMSALDVG